MQRQYSTIEAYLFDDPRFLRLNWSSRLTWLWLLGKQDRMRCPGIVRGSALDVGEFLNHGMDRDDPDDLSDAIRVGYDSVVSLADLGWVEYDKRAKLFFLPNAVSHNWPRCTDQLVRWYRSLINYPPSPLIRRWVKAAADTLSRAHGSDHEWAVISSGIARRLTQKGGLVCDKFLMARKGGRVTGIYSGYPPDYDDPIKDVVTSYLSEGKATKAPKSTGRTSKKKTDIPSNFTPHQVEIWTTLREQQFWVPGVGLQTAFDNVSDPVGLVRRLTSGKLARVDAGLIIRLAQWTQENQGKKLNKRLGGFLVKHFTKQAEEMEAENSVSSPSPGNVFSPSKIDRKELEAQRKKTMEMLKNGG